MRRLALILAALLALGLSASAQFRTEAFSQNYSDSTDTEQADTSGFFSFRDFGQGLAHKKSVKLQTMFIGSVFTVGGLQIYNGDYWKLPIIYTGFGASMGTGIYYGVKYKESVKAYESALEEDPLTTLLPDESLKRRRNIGFAAAGAVAWATLMDGVICYPGRDRPDPTKAALYSLLVPGLGQIYNGEYWKVPLYWGLIGGGVKYYFDNRRNYERYRSIYHEATSEDPTVTAPPISAENAKYYRDVFRRYRDYSVLATTLFYLLQVIDANVFAYMQDFELTDDISMRMSPAVITPDYAFNPAVGLSVGIKF